MGCGAVCGDSSPLDIKILRNSQVALKLLLPKLKPNHPLISQQQYNHFCRQVTQNSTRYHLIIPTIIASNEVVPEQVMQKWKILLYSLEAPDKVYQECVEMKFQMEAASMIFHESFIQIGKDVDRTFPLPESKRGEFQRVLKRITNHFPQMGYTQGINFIIGYLLIIGYSEADSFWMFVHIALNPRYLFLGLYEDGFPLSNVYSFLFGNMLRRLNEKLYNHLYEFLQMEPSMWVFKWFMTFYLYSFPLQFCKYIWDLVIELGGLSIVVFAVVLTIELEAHLLKISDMGQFVSFFQQLSNLQNFNNTVILFKLISKTYRNKLERSDYQGLKGIGGFYGEYLLTCATEEQETNKKSDLDSTKATASEKVSEEMLKKWYKSIINQRKQFEIRGAQTKINLAVELKVNKESENVQKLQVPIQLTDKDKKPRQEKKVQGKRMRLQSAYEGVQLKRGWRRRVPDHLSSEINQCFDEQDSHSMQSKSSKSRKSNKNEIFQMEQIDKLGMKNQRAQKSPVKFNNYAKPVNQAKQEPLKVTTQNYNGMGLALPRRNNYSLRQQKGKKGPLMIAGQNSLAGYDSCSVSSKNSVVIPKQKMQKSGRVCACKTKTEENRLQNIDRGSEREEEKQSEKSSMRRYSQQQGAAQVSGKSVAESLRQRVGTQGDFMISSHGPGLKVKRKIGESGLESRGGDEVEVLPFKKNKQSRVDIPNVTIRERRQKLMQIGLQNDQQSMESIQRLSFDKHSQVNSNYSSNKMGSQVLEVQSIK